jgi:hypothetical protein
MYYPSKALLNRGLKKMMTPHVILQTGNATSISSVLNQFVSQVGVPVFDAILFIGGVSFIIAIILSLLYLVEYLWHPTSWGKTSALSEAITHAKRPILGAFGMFLIIYITLLVIGLVSGESSLASNAVAYAFEILKSMFKVTVSILGYLLQHATTGT